jgi:hypothetical protein
MPAMVETPTDTLAISSSLSSASTSIVELQLNWEVSED